LVPDARTHKIDRRSSREHLEESPEHPNRFDLLRRHIDHPIEELIDEISVLKSHLASPMFLDAQDASLPKLLEAFKKHHTVYIVQGGDLVSSYSLSKVLFQLMTRL